MIHISQMRERFLYDQFFKQLRNRFDRKPILTDGSRRQSMKQAKG
jgi:hypothetical protein